MWVLDTVATDGYSVVMAKQSIDALMADLSERAEIEAGENLYLGRGALGYVGEPTEFRFSELFAQLLPGEKYNRLVELIEEHDCSPAQARKMLAAAKATLNSERAKS